MATTAMAAVGVGKMSVSAEKRQHSDVWNKFYEEEKRNLEESLLSFMQAADRNLSPIGTPATGAEARRYLAEMPSFEQSQLVVDSVLFDQSHPPENTSKGTRGLPVSNQGPLPSSGRSVAVSSRQSVSQGSVRGKTATSSVNLYVNNNNMQTSSSSRPLQPINPNSMSAQFHPSSSSRRFDQSSTQQSTQQLIEQRKQLIIDALMKIRGKVHIQHEETLKKQQTALIATIDAKIKEEARRHKQAFPLHIQKQITAMYLKNVATGLKVDENVLPNLHNAIGSEDKAGYQVTTNDHNAVLYTTDYTLEQLKGLVDQYVKSKKDIAMHAIHGEVSQLVDQSNNRSLHMSQLNASSASRSTVSQVSSKINLQESLKKIMDEAKIQEDTFWNSVMNAKSMKSDHNSSTVLDVDKKKIDGIKTLYRKNMQVAAQICVLRQLQQQQQGSR